MKTNRIRSAQGSTLIEALVTLTLLCTALISIGMLLTGSMRSMAESSQRQRAVRLASDFAEILQGMAEHMDVSVVNSADHDCAANVCTPQEFLGHSVQRWQARTAHELPEGQASYQLNTAAGMQLAVIELRWRVGRAGEHSHRLTVPLARQP